MCPAGLLEVDIDSHHLASAPSEQPADEGSELCRPHECSCRAVFGRASEVSPKQFSTVSLGDSLPLSVVCVERSAGLGGRIGSS